MHQTSYRIDTNISPSVLPNPLYLYGGGLDERIAGDGNIEGASGMAETDASTVCYVYLLGSLAIHDTDGAIRTPKAQKARALVALLALAPRGARSRVWLRDKLWSESGEEQSSASLRQALTDVRRSLGE